VVELGEISKRDRTRIQALMRKLTTTYYYLTVGVFGGAIVLRPYP